MVVVDRVFAHDIFLASNHCRSDSDSSQGAAVLTKRCIQCRQIKPGRDFYSHASNKDGLTGACKLCTLFNRKRYHDSRREEENEARKARRNLARFDRELVAFKKWKRSKDGAALDQYSAWLARSKIKNINDYVK
jgi:hypothetical protein